jgi:hypothetical protein
VKTKGRIEEYKLFIIIEKVILVTKHKNFISFAQVNIHHDLSLRRSYYLGNNVVNNNKEIPI